MKRQKKKINWEIVGLILILCFAFFLRVYSLGNPPLWVDESISTNIAKNIIQTGTTTLDSDLNEKTYFLHYLMAFFMLFGQTEFFARFVSVLFGLATIILAYFIGKEYSKSGGIISALFFAVFYLEVFFSRQARYYQLFQLAFFLSIYLLYKSKEKPILIYPALIAFIIALDTHLEGLVLSFFFIAHILIYNRKQWFLSIIPIIPIVNKLLTTISLTAGTAVNYASNYLGYTRNMYYMLILFIPGLIWAFVKKKRLTLMIILPSILTLVGVFSLQVFAFRYAYFFVFPLVLYAALLMSFLYDKYGKLILIPILILILMPSNLFYPQTYVNVIVPVDYQFFDTSSPTNDYKNLPLELKDSIINGNDLLISYFSSDVSFYLRKPDLVVPFSLNGIGEDQVSYNNSKGEVVDRYSGAQILKERPNESYYLTADFFSTKKLKSAQLELYNSLTANCTKSYSSQDLIVWHCLD
ncbi:MAG: glycosyltransferase family 39 protein [archaeon]